MTMYQHDSANLFRFVLGGNLTSSDAQLLGWAWESARSILDHKELMVDVTRLNNVDPAGIDILSRMQTSGARIVAAQPPQCEELLRFIEISEAAPLRRGRFHGLALRILRTAGRSA